MAALSTPLAREDYQIAIICALPLERVAAVAMFDDSHDEGPERVSGDNNIYSYGRIGKHNVVAASLPKGKYGEVSAAAVTTDMRRTFGQSVRFVFMVGIAGAMGGDLRDKESDVRLGDVVVGTAQGLPAVIHYEAGKETANGLQIRSELSGPPVAVLSAVGALEATHSVSGPTYLLHLNTMLQKYKRFSRPSIKGDYYDRPLFPDRMFKSSTQHAPSHVPTVESDDEEVKAENAASQPAKPKVPDTYWPDECKACSQSKDATVELTPRVLSDPPDSLIQDDVNRPKFIQSSHRDKETVYDYPYVHYGTIASADKLMKNSSERDEVYKRLKEQKGVKALCFEMEAVGVTESWHCLIVRGICDYADAHKNDAWQRYAAATAAAYVKDLLMRIPPEEVSRAVVFNDLVAKIKRHNRPDELRKELAPWLFSDFNGDKPIQPDLIKLNLDAMASGTGQRLTETIDTAWLPSKVPHMWIHGYKDSGKSILCASTIARLTKASVDSGGYVLVYGLFARDLGYTQSPNFLLLTILAQLCSLEPIPTALDTVYKNLHNMITIDMFEVLKNVATEWETCLRKRNGLESSQTISQMILIVDGLDEVSPGKKRDDAIKTLKRISQLNDLFREFRIRLIIFSQYDAEIEKLCDPQISWWLHKMKYEDVKEEIRTAMISGVEGSGRLRDCELSRREEIAAALLAKSHGSFRVASMYLEYLKTYVSWDINENGLDYVLSQTPNPLNALYTTLLDRNEVRDSRKDILVLLRAILYAAEQLYVDEAVEICAFRPSQTLSFVPRWSRESVVKYLNGFILPRYDDCIRDLVSQDRSVRLGIRDISVAVYLLQMDPTQRNQRRDFFHKTEAHLDYARKCLGYLLHCHCDAQSAGKKYPFLEYAWRNWSLHVASYLKSKQDPDQGNDLDPYREDELQSTYQDDIELTPPVPHALLVRNIVFQPALYPSDLVGEIESSICSITGSTSARKTTMLTALRSPPAQLQRSIQTTQLRHPEESFTERVPIHYRPHMRTLPPYPRSTRFFVMRQTPQEPLGPLTGALIVDSLDNTPTCRYTAIAHRWAYQGGSSSIQIRGEQAQEVVVYSDTVRALRHIQPQYPTSAFWVDEISVNMHDFGERMQQIELIPDIFRSADQVVVWLGEQTRDRRDWRAVSALAQSHITEGDMGVDLDTATWLFDHDLWRRLWIYQEIALAREVWLQYDGANVNLQKLLHVFEAVSKHFYQPTSIFQDWACDANLLQRQGLRICHILGRLRVGGQSIDVLRNSSPSKSPCLPELLYLLRNADCSVPCDRFYSLYTMLSPDEYAECPTEKDYMRPFQDVSITLTVWIAQKYGFRSVLAINNVGGEYSHKIPMEVSPSWIPRWNEAIYDYPLAPGPFNLKQPAIYRRTDGSESRWKEPQISPSGYLSIKVIWLGRVRSTTPLIEPGPSRQDCAGDVVLINARDFSAEGHLEFAQLHFEVRGMVARFQHYIGDEARLEQDLARTVMEDRVMKAQEVFERLPRDMDKSMWQTCIRELIAAFGSQNFRGNRKCRTIFVSNDGVLGNGPLETRRKDHLAMLPGAQVPHVLRATSSTQGETYYRIVGECYLDGQMDRNFAEELTHSILVR